MRKIIEISDLTVTYDNFIALENVNLDIFQEDFLGVIGPNGGGKTTLIKSILGLVPYSGAICFDPLIAHKNEKAIGYLPQQTNLDPKFPISVREIVISGLQSSSSYKTSYKNKESREKADYLLETMNISDIAGKNISEISGGQLQRALLCRAVISEPRLLILDEPANFVDNKFEKELYEQLKVLNNNMAIIMVSHDIGTISSVVKNIVCVNKHVHRHNSNVITHEQLENYDCPIQLVYHGSVPHTVLEKH